MQARPSGVFDTCMRRSTDPQITERPISVVKFDPTGDYLAVGAHDSIAYIVKTEDLSVVAKCKGNSSYINQIDWDSSGIAIQTCSGAYELLFYNATRCVCNANRRSAYPCREHVLTRVHVR